MPRKPWSELSDNYRARLTRAGITPEQHANPTVSIKKARGHESTPEHPEQKYQPQFRDYFRKRRDLEVRVNAKKRRLFGSSHKWRGSRSSKYVREGYKGKKPKLSRMQEFLSPDFDIMDIDWSDEEWAFLYYH